jgi:hypothetical protein
LKCDAERTNLFVYVDGDSALFVETRNFVEQSRFSQRLCIQRKPDGKYREFDIQRRRLRIAAIKNETKQYIEACDYVMGLEDDSIPRPDALERLLRAYSLHPFAGFISGVQLGRWGIPHLGAWTADDVYGPKQIRSLALGQGIHEVDAAGWYCYLTKRANYMKFDYAPFDGNQLGPDVQWGLDLRRDGLKNYVDWDVPVEHRLQSGEVLMPGRTLEKQVSLSKRQAQWEMNVLI